LPNGRAGRFVYLPKGNCLLRRNGGNKPDWNEDKGKAKIT